MTVVESSKFRWETERKREKSRHVVLKTCTILPNDLCVSTCRLDLNCENKSTVVAMVSQMLWDASQKRGSFDAFRVTNETERRMTSIEWIKFRSNSRKCDRENSQRVWWRNRCPSSLFCNHASSCVRMHEMTLSGCFYRQRRTDGAFIITNNVQRTNTMWRSKMIHIESSFLLSKESYTALF